MSIVLLFYYKITFNTRLPFRQLVRYYGVDIAYTPMIMADSFVNSSKARFVEFEFDKGLYSVIVYITSYLLYIICKGIEHMHFIILFSNSSNNPLFSDDIMI